MNTAHGPGRSAATDARPLRILYLIDEMEAITAGGTERQILQMIGLLQDSGFDVTLGLFRGTDWLSPETAGCRIHNFRFGSLASPKGLWDLGNAMKWIRQQRFDIVQTFFYEANIVGPVLAKLARVPLVIGSRRNLNYYLGPISRWGQRVADLFTDRLHANCDAVRQTVARLESFSVDHIDVIYNGLDAAYLRAASDEGARTRTALGVRDDQILIGNISTLRPVKGVDVFVEAAAVIAKQVPSARFIVVGDGPERARIDEMIRQHGLTTVLTMAGSQEDIRPYLWALDIGVLSSHSEGLSNTLLEYLVAGLPIVATDVGGDRELLADAGVLVPARDAAALANAMLSLITDPERRLQLRSAAQQRANDFSLDRAKEALVRAYRDHSAPADAHRE